MPIPSTPGRFFGPDALAFLRDLSRHNDRPWFQENKGRYERAVQAPALRFIEAMAPKLARLSSHLVADARPFGGSMTRIYRDTRFSKDQSPYHTHIGIHFSHDQAGKEQNLPGFFFRLCPGESFVASGVWRPEPPALNRIRRAIVTSPTSWGRAVGNGVELGGESYVRVPPGIDPNHRYANDLRHKDFVAMLPFRDREISAPSFGRGFEAACRRLNPLNRFLAGALGIPW
ncbi:MAG TPA: TIGR02453 family protein [Thermoplasmata archaeon]|nr:TIGR02453 family protein [Thermoplasmata archaeon]